MDADLEVYLGQIAAIADEAVAATRRERGLSPDEIDRPVTPSLPHTTVDRTATRPKAPTMTDFEPTLAALTTVRCPGCISYYQCGSVEFTPIGILDRHLVELHGWTNADLARWLDTNRAPMPAHKGPTRL